METWDQIPALSRAPALSNRSRVQTFAGGSDPPHMAEQQRHWRGEMCAEAPPSLVQAERSPGCIPSPANCALQKTPTG